MPDVQRQALNEAGLLLLNKSAGLDTAARARVISALPAVPLVWSDHGRLDLSLLPGQAVQACSVAAVAELPSAASPLAQLWRHADEPIWQIQDQAEGWSIGWRWHPSQRFDLARVTQWLQSLAWLRAKAVLQGDEGWFALNALQGQAVDNWCDSEWRKDSRLELIFSQRQDGEALTAAFAQCRIEATG